jgi:CAAX prenyl protease-like protein
VIRSKSVPYVGPFFALIALLALSRARLPVSPFVIQAEFVVLMLLVISAASRHAPDLQKTNFRVQHWAGSALLGALVFVIWIGPDRLFPGYRHHWIFENALMGTARPGTLPDSPHHLALWLRAFRAVAIVPLVEELFWRGWLMRWIIAPDFLTVAPGTWSASAFWVVAVLFACEHGSFWEVGLAAGLLYNWWMIRTKSLADVTVAHAVTNACLSAYVVAAGKSEYWS